MSNIDIDLFTQQSEMRGNNDEIIIEITGLKSLTSFIGLDDTPYYYENGKFFKVDGNKIVYADIEYKDLKGDIQENKELLEQIQSISEEASKKYVEQIVSQIIDVHNADVNAHPYIQNIIEENYNTLDEKIDGININLTKELEELEQDVNDKYNELVQDIDDLTDVVEEGYNQLTQDLANEKLAREQADTTLQNNIDTLSQTVSDNYTTLDTKIDTTATTINQRITDVADELNQTIEENVVALQQEDTALQNQINTHSQTLTSHDERITANSNAIVQEASDREDADNDLQEQIDAIVASSDVKDIVGTKEELDNYDKTKLGDRDIIKVLEDNTQNNASTYYRYVASTTSFTYIGKEGPFYTKSESDDKFVPKTRTINNKDLSTDVTLAVEDLANAENYVQFTDYATSSKGGVIKISGAYGASITSSGALYSSTIAKETYDTRSDGLIISKGTLENIKESLITDVADDKYGAELDYTDTTLSLKNANGEPLSEVTIKSTPDLDGETISLNDDGELQVIGNVLTNGGIQNYWCGSKSDYDAIQNKDPNTLYEVLDEINDIVTEIPTATLDDIGLVKPDGVTISIDNNGTISASNTALLNHNTSNIAHTDLFSAKANVNLNNIPSNYDFITETGLWGDGESGYIKYKSKYMEQWGKVTSNSTGVVEFTMHKPFKDMNYSIFAQIGELGNFFISCFPSANQKFKLRVQTAQGSNVAVRVMWRAYGYSV